MRRSIRSANGKEKLNEKRAKDELFSPLGIMATCSPPCVMADVSSQREKDNFRSHITAQAVMIGSLESPQDSGGSGCMYVCEDGVDD